MTIRKILSVVAMVALLLPIIASCGEQPIEQPAAVELTVAADKQSEYVLVYPQSATRAQIKEYKEFSSRLREHTFVFFEMKTDAEPPVEGAKEILLGETNRAASAELYNSFGENQIGFLVKDQQIAIGASYKDGFLTAAEEFLARYAKDYAVKVMSDLSLRIQCEMGIGYQKVSNTRDIGGDDPWVVEHNGSYYYCWSEGGVKVAKVDSLDQIVKSRGKQVFSANGDFHNIWAPELHYIDGSWYIYVAMCWYSTENADHRMYVLKGSTQDPTDPFYFIGEVKESSGCWAIDQTVFQYKGELYTVWSGWPSQDNGNQYLYIAHMRDPRTIDSDRVMISMPTKGYETVTTGPSVNEGPAVLVKDDRVIVVYSANGSWTDDYLITAIYCDDGNLLNAKSWTKLEKPLLSKGASTFGPGHCSFTTAIDGSLWMIYHANIQSGSGWNGRSVRIQPVEWKDNLPHLGGVRTTVNLPVMMLIPSYEIKE